ncbi:MAG: hypothetical protein KKH94_08805 [Candidatus Omnitrophica bacterium]|nr:hypothetical protein [Candidatus Omnitrophota bacterium]
MKKKNVIFFTQSSNLDMFYHTSEAMKEYIALDKIGFYVTDSRFYKKFITHHRTFHEQSLSILKEWENIRSAKDVTVDMTVLRQYEEEIGQPFLWDALVADRRIYWGRKYSYDQDYRARFNHEQMLAILQVGLNRLEAFFDEVRPDFIVSFQCLTLGDFLSYLIARKRNIHILNLRPTRIRNYFYAGETVYEPSRTLQDTYEHFLNQGIEAHLRDRALNYVQEVRQSHAMYEGVVRPSQKPPARIASQKRFFGLPKLKNIIELFSEGWKYNFGEYRDDNHSVDPFGCFLGQRIVGPWRAQQMEGQFRKLYVTADQLSSLTYAFFPLHTEPEVTLSVYSKAYLNQIEVVRLISHNLPVGMKLVIKEHPWSIGKRPLSYYRKLMAIPNVMLSQPAITSRDLICHARIVTVIAGSIGFEGIVLKKPVIVLGGAPYNYLPSSMIRYAANPMKLGEEIRALLEQYEYKEEALLSYVAAVMQESVSVDFYSRLLKRPGAYNPDGLGDEESQTQEWAMHIKTLARYLVDTVAKRETPLCAKKTF